MDFPSLPKRWALASIRVRILVGFVGMLALATIGSVLVAREVITSRLDERIDRDLAQEASELRRLAAGVDPATAEPFGDDVRRIFRVFFAQNTPSRGEAVLTFVDGEPFLRSRQVVGYRLDQDPQLVEHWGSLTQSERGEVDTPAGPVDFLAVPLHDDGRVLGVFVVSFFRELEADVVDDATIATAGVGLAVLLIGSLLAWRVAESVLRPVRTVTQTARSITETDFSRRIDVRGNDEVAELAAAFNATLDRLESAFVTQRRFLNDAGHELKTPLTIVTGHLELLGEEPAEREATLALVLDELDRMSRIVNDLLLLAKAEAPDFLHLETVDVGVLTDEVQTKAAALAPRRWTVDARGRGRVVADRQRLTQALMQLAENAAKQTEEDDEIAVGSRVEDGEARFWVRDEGPGIPRDDQARVFTRFSRGAGSHRGEGSGLGLSIVQAIAQAHHGRVELVSREGAGATFTLVLPVDQPEAVRA
ncbi:MAG TPA: HAMP domain-containing sensor histidine kinase [Gaiellaceae bacterium]|nr:HAMP domain-containing sensor histidine kinase [Gaiellaceae bacterium]